MNEWKLAKLQVLEDIKLWQEAPAQTEVEYYYKKRLLDSVKRLLTFEPDYIKDLQTTMISELEAKIRKELKES